MTYVILFYFVTALWVFAMRYAATSEERKERVRERWYLYFLQCLGWPLMLMGMKGFDK